MRCPSCASDIPETSRFCLACGASVDPSSSTPTRTHLREGGYGDVVAPGPARRIETSPEAASSPGSDARGAERFAPGTLLAGRYRIVGLLGRGGMGEVYRADDLKLGRPVALKFLPQGLEAEPGRLGRFLNEIRLALKVTHPNVCRVHDVGETNGQHFLSMEYVDGEDLASLLRQIGRFPADRAVRVARQLCAGLAAAHEQGILHRDLKPANVMIDGRGQAKITDFGLAGIAEELKGPQARLGTPAYMAPEQFEGREVTVRSDVYALGLVLYELFTGKPAFEGPIPAELARRHRETTPISLASLVDGLDPAVERVVLRCLEKDPKLRPASALAVAAALPGGDPIAAALAAGETPSPELLAEAGQAGGLSPAVAWAGLAAFLVGAGLVVMLGGTTQLVRMVHLGKPPDVLAERAREVAVRAGYEEAPADSLLGFQVNDAYVSHLAKLGPRRDAWAPLRRSRPAGLLFWYRQSPQALVRFSGGSLGDWFIDPPGALPGMVQVALDPAGRLRRSGAQAGLLFWYRQSPQALVRFSGGSLGDWFIDPPGALPGMVQVALDPAGRLQSFKAAPPEHDETGELQTGPDWGPLLAAAGLDPTALREVDPSWAPPVFADRRVAWEGVYPDAADVSIRVEAASYKGRPVSLRIIEPWTEPSASHESPASAAKATSEALSAALFAVAVIGAAAIAARNVRLGRGDRRTALRFALYLAAVRILWLLGAHHVTTAAELDVFIGHLAYAMYRVGLVWIFYLALEPYARRLWPQMLVSWVRLFGGQFRDPLVGRDLLVGSVFGVALSTGHRLSGWTADRLGLAPVIPDSNPWSLEALRGLRHAVAATLAAHTISVLYCFVFITLFLVLRILLRRTWAAVAIVTLIGIFSFYPGTGSVPVYVVFVLFTLAMFWFVLFRFGLLSMVAGLSIGNLLTWMPITFDLSAWYAGAGLPAVLLLLGVTAWAFHTSVSGRPLFRDEILETGAPAVR